MATCSQTLRSFYICFLLSAARLQLRPDLQLLFQVTYHFKGHCRLMCLPDPLQETEGLWEEKEGLYHWPWNRHTSIVVIKRDSVIKLPNKLTFLNYGHGLESPESESHLVMLDSATAWIYNPWTFWAKILEWVAIPFFKGSSQPRNRSRVSSIAGGFFTS